MESAQEQQDAMMKENLKSMRSLKDLVQSQSESTSSEASSGSYDPIENAMRRHPGLTREKAEAMAELYGF